MRGGSKCSATASNVPGGERAITRVEQEHFWMA